MLEISVRYSNERVAFQILERDAPAVGWRAEISSIDFSAPAICREHATQPSSIHMLLVETLGRGLDRDRMDLVQRHGIPELSQPR